MSLGHANNKEGVGCACRGGGGLLPEMKGKILADHTS